MGYLDVGTGWPPCPLLKSPPPPRRAAYVWVFQQRGVGETPLQYMEGLLGCRTPQQLMGTALEERRWS